MPLEFYGADLSDHADREGFINTYAFFESLEVSIDDDLVPMDSKFSKWVEDYPDEVKDFLIFLSQHDEPKARELAGILCDGFKDQDPELTTRIAERLLDDNDQEVKRRVSDYWRDVLHDEADEILGSLGLARTVRVIRAYKSAVRSLKDGTNAAG